MAEASSLSIVCPLCQSTRVRVIAQLPTLLACACKVCRSAIHHCPAS